MLCFWSRINVQQMVELDDECKIIKKLLVIKKYVATLVG